MISPGAVLALAAAAAGVAAAAGPASAFARRYLVRLERPGDALQDAPWGQADRLTQQPQVRARWLLNPLPQAALATVLAVTTLVWGLRAHAPTETVTALPATGLLASACSVDAVCHRLPNRLLAATAAWLAAAVTVTTLAPFVTALLLGEEAPAGTLWPAARALLCAAGAGGGVLVLALLPSGLGLGDVKLSAVLGLWLAQLGAGTVLAGVVLGFLLGGAAASLLIVTRRTGRKDHLALGPYLGAGGWLSWLMALG